MRPEALHNLPSPSQDDASPSRERCILVGLNLKQPVSGPDGASHFTAEESLRELKELARSAGAEVIGSTAQTRERPDPATWIGRGKITEVKAWADETEADFILLDRSLSPSQQRNLERELGHKVIDRTQLILDIFARHARTREGQLQVELAQLNYLLPRLTGRGAELSRLGGGIGTRGPGETKLETDRRRIARRIAKLKQEIEKVRQTRALQRKKRSGVPLATVALVGYTNAGKSTLFNALTAASVLADARMFATLDPTLRAIELPSGRRALLSDTVGFIRGLPPALVDAFRATLEEVTQAALILHVVDLSASSRAEQMDEVRKILRELDAAGKPQILVLNKADLLPPIDVEEQTASLRAGDPAAEVAAVSAKKRTGLDELIAAVDRRLPSEETVQETLRFSHEEGDQVAYLYEHAAVLRRRDHAGGVDLFVEIPVSLKSRFESHLVESAP